MNTIFDAVVMGGGPGGYVVTLQAAQDELSVVCIDNGVNAQGKPSSGGACLNVSCIPSESLLQSSEPYTRVQHGVGIHGVNIKSVSFNTTAMIQRKDAIVNYPIMGVSSPLKKNKMKRLYNLVAPEYVQDEIW